VVALHRHCPCNGIWLCHTCHKHLHKNPEQATRLGFIVTSYEAQPFNVPVWTTWGWRYHDCNGGFEWVENPPVDAEAALLRKEQDA